MIKKSHRAVISVPLLTLAWICILTGCSGTPSVGSLEVRSLGDAPVLLDSNIRTSVFAHDPKAATSFWLSSVSIDDLLSDRVDEGLIIHIDLLWVPRAGSTPMDASATNVSIRYIVISRGQVGVYVGAGFALPSGNLEGRSVTLTVRDASLELVEKTDGFNDLLTPAQISGRFSSQSDPEQVRKLHVMLSQFVTDALGKTRYVMRTKPAVPAPKM